MNINQQTDIDLENLHGAVEVTFEGNPVPKIFVMWSLAGCESIRIAMRDAAKKYQDIYGVRPEYAFVSKLPNGVENGVEVDDLMLFEANWMVSKCVAVGYLYK